MAGLYIHIPFCKQKCSYCNFHFSTNLSGISSMVDAIVLELQMRHSYLRGEKLGSIYLGGGTPSLLSNQHLDRIWDTIRQHYDILDDAEITLEANPDDLNANKMAELRESIVNRLSIGVQSFRAEDLMWMRRAHNEVEARNTVQVAVQYFDNVTIDLIYGIPGLTDNGWVSNIREAVDLGVRHLSCYALTVEPRTLLAHQVKKGVIKPVDDLQMERHFQILLDTTREYGFIQYEISNFALPGNLAIHNTNYWREIPYLGIGPSAHSYNGKERSWNISNNARYIQAIEKGEIFAQTEVLTPDQRYNEYVMTGLRTMWGCDIQKVKELGSLYQTQFERDMVPFITNRWVIKRDGIYRLTDQGKLFADYISSELFAI